MKKRVAFKAVSYLLFCYCVQKHHEQGKRKYSIGLMVSELGVHGSRVTSGTGESSHLDSQKGDL